MIEKLKIFWSLIKQAGINWNKNEPWAQSASIAYYALFSLPSLLIIIVFIAGNFFGTEAVQGRISQEIGDYIGESAAKAIEGIIANSMFTNSSTIMIIFGVAFLLFGATGVFFHLKKAVNNIWDVAPKRYTVLRTAINRAVSFGMVLGLGFLLLVSLIISAILAAFGDFMTTVIPSFSNTLVQVCNFIISFLFITALFAAIFRWLPDVRLKWKTTYLGAVLTTVLFLIGEFLIGLYLGMSNPTSVYGAASAVVLILLWVYYICLILFYGVEFTVQYAFYKQEEIVPNQYAEPAIYQKLENIKKKKGFLLDQERIMKMINSDSDKTDSK